MTCFWDGILHALDNSDFRVVGCNNRLNRQQLINLLKTKNVEIEEFDIWKDPAKAKEMLQRTNGARTIPQIFIGDHYVGGNDKLQEANRNGELDKILTS